MTRRLCLGGADIKRTFLAEMNPACREPEVGMLGTRENLARALFVFENEGGGGANFVSVPLFRSPSFWKESKHSRPGAYLLSFFLPSYSFSFDYAPVFCIISSAFYTQFGTVPPATASCPAPPSHLMPKKMLIKLFFALPRPDCALKTN